MGYSLSVPSVNDPSMSWWHSKMVRILIVRCLRWYTIRDAIS